MIGKLPQLILNECRLQIYEMKQYWVETLFGLLFLSGIFLALFFGIKIFVQDADNSVSLDGLMMGYVIFTFCSGAYNAVPETLGGYTQKGFLEQLYMTPYGFSWLILARVVATLFISMLSTVILAYFAMAVSGNWIALNFAVLMPLLFLAAPSIIGVGMVIGGLTLVYKRIGIISSLAMLGIIGLISVPALPFGATSLLPLASGAHLTRLVVLEQQALQPAHVLIVFLNSAFYLMLGLFIYRKLERLAKKKNLIGQY